MSSTSPKVSVLVLAYNQERYIAQAIQSALDQQTEFAIEIVIGEDCSTDRTRDILKRLAEDNPDLIRLLLREKNLGGTENFYDTLRQCRGEYVAMLEGDDYWTNPQKLQMQADALGEIQLTDAIDKLARVANGYGVLCKGKRFDIGIPEGLLAANQKLSR